MHGAQRIRDDQGQPVTGRPEPLLYYFDGSAIVAGRRCGSRTARARADALRGDRARRRHAGLLRAAGRQRDLLRDRSGRDPDRARSHAVQLPQRVPPGCSDRAGRCPPDARRSPGRKLRSHHRRCVLVRCHPDSPADARSDGDLPEEARAARHDRPAHLEPPPGARVGRRRHRGGQRPRHAPARQRRPRTSRTSMPAPSRRSRATTPTSAYSPPRPSGRCTSRMQSSGCGPTIIPTSSAR